MFGGVKESASTASTNSVPRTASDDSLASRPPWAFSEGADESAILAEYRTHLLTVAESSPDAVVLAYVFLKRRITEDELSEYMKVYNFKGGKNASIQLHIDPDSTVALPWPDSITTMSLMREHVSQFLTGIPDPENDFETNRSMPSTLAFDSFSAYATTKSLERFWIDRGEVVRGIGILGREGQTRGMWTTIKPDEPINP